MLGNKPIYGLDSHLKPTCQASPQKRLVHIPCRPCKALGTSQTNLLCSRKKQQHEPSHPQWTYCSPQKRTVCVPPWSKADNTSQKRHLKPIHRWCSGTNQSTAWIATWNQPARLPHIPCRPCKALGTSQTNLLCSRKKQQHEPSHPQWTYCSPQKRTVCVPPCIKSRQHLTKTTP